MAEQQNSFVRWQEIRIKQLTDVNRLVIGLATGLLAALNLKADQLNSLSPRQQVAGITSAGFALISVGVGIATAWNRYQSFRATALVARRREQQPKAKDRSPEQGQAIDQLREDYQTWTAGARTFSGFNYLRSFWQAWRW
jgi:hypothetical protein